MNNLRKFFHYIKTSGVKQTLILVYQFFLKSFKHRHYRSLYQKARKDLVERLTEKVKNKNVFVFIPSVEWYFLFQRAQQMALSYAKRENIVVLYLSMQNSCDTFHGYKELAENLYLVNYSIVDDIDSLPAHEVTTFIYNINFYDLSKRYKSDRLVYEYVDDLSVTVTSEMEYFTQVHMDLLKNADLTVVTAKNLYKEAALYAKNILLSPNAVDYEFFSQQQSPNVQVQKRAEGFNCVLGYYGALASWFDYELVKESAKRHPDWLWVLIGKKINNDMEKSNVEKLSNVMYIPSVPYTELPSYIACCDILTIPFLRNDITKATSPVKLFEYMASCKPILVSDLEECREYPSVAIYHDLQEFEELAQKLLKKKDDESFQATLIQDAKNNTWDARTDAILTILMENKK